MTEHTKIAALHRRLLEERRKLVETAANSEVLPPSKFLAYLASLDGATVATEAMLDRDEPGSADQANAG